MALPLARKEVAVLGEEDFVTGFRLAGVKKAFTVDASKPAEELHESLSRILAEICGDPSIGVVIIQYKLREVAEKLLKAVQHPLILFLPDSRDARKIDIRELYLRQIRSFLGISVEV